MKNGTSFTISCEQSNHHIKFLLYFVHHSLLVFTITGGRMTLFISTYLFQEYCCFTAKHIFVIKKYHPTTTYLIEILKLH